jgi:P4 family phage/plasmid primase-like protien
LDIRHAFPPPGFKHGLKGTRNKQTLLSVLSIFIDASCKKGFSRMVAHPSDASSPLPITRLDISEVRRALQVLTLPGQVAELRVLQATTRDSSRFPYQASGYFNDHEALIKALKSLRSAKGVYLTLQPCKPDLLARAHNRLRSSDEMRKASATSDQYVTRLRWLLVDLDPERPADISTTEEEHEAALELARSIKDALQALGWPDPVEADSGNGAHLLYQVDLPVREGAKETGLLHRVLKGLAARFDQARERVGDEPLRLLVDQTVYNPSRICKLYGTLACKGDSMLERPHRLSRLLVVPEQVATVPLELLEAMATPLAQPTPAPTERRSTTRAASAFDLEHWIEQHGLDVSGPMPWRDGQKWIFSICPWNAEHTDASAFLVQHGNGVIGAGCQHNGCRGKGWRDLRALFEPAVQHGPDRPHAAPEPEPVSRTAPVWSALLVVDDIDLAFVLECWLRQEEGDARLYERLFQGRSIYDHTEGAWYMWQEHYWQRDHCEYTRTVQVSGTLADVYKAASEVLERYLKQHALHHDFTQKDDKAHHITSEQIKALEKIQGNLKKRADGLRVLNRANNVLTYAQALLATLSNAWDTNPWLLGTPDGVIDLQTGTLHPGRPDEYIRTCIPTGWQGLDAPAPRFERFLYEIFGDREARECEELVGFLQRALGYGISGNVREHMFLMLYGEEGRNGKDTLMSCLLAVLGAVVGPVSNDVILASNKLATPGSASPHLCSLQGKRVVWASETDRGARFDIGQVKFLTGGGSIPARQIYGRSYSFDPTHLLVLLTNHKPHADASDAAFWDRLCPLIFNLRFVEHPTQPNERQRDPTLSQALQAEASGILAWLVRGCLDWQAHGLQVPPTVRRARYDYRAEEDTLGTFLKERCLFAEGMEVRAGQLYACYKDWAVENGLKYMSGRTFGLEIKKRVICFTKNVGIFYQGITLLNEMNRREQSETETVFQAQPSEITSSSFFQPDKTIKSGGCGGYRETFGKNAFSKSENTKKEKFPLDPPHPPLFSPVEHEENGFIQPVETDETIFREDFLENDPSLSVTDSITYEEFYL